MGGVPGLLALKGDGAIPSYQEAAESVKAILVDHPKRANR
jgi:hypothetical protein